MHSGNVTYKLKVSKCFAPFFASVSPLSSKDSEVYELSDCSSEVESERHPSPSASSDTSDGKHAKPYSFTSTPSTCGKLNMPQVQKTRSDLPSRSDLLNTRAVFTLKRSASANVKLLKSELKSPRSSFELDF